MRIGVWTHKHLLRFGLKRGSKLTPILTRYDWRILGSTREKYHQHSPGSVICYIYIIYIYHLYIIYISSEVRIVFFGWHKLNNMKQPPPTPTSVSSLGYHGVELFRGGEVVKFPWQQKGRLPFLGQKGMQLGTPFLYQLCCFLRLLGCQMWMMKEETEETLFFSECFLVLLNFYALFLN